MLKRPWQFWTRVHYGWVITSAALVIGITAYGVYYSFTLFYPFMVEEFGWSRAAISGAMSVGLVAYGVFALPIGWCVDRLGPRLTIGLGGVLFGLGTFLGSRVTALWHVYALYGGLTAIGMGAAWAPLVSTISRWFVVRRGLAIGIGKIVMGLLADRVGGGSAFRFTTCLAIVTMIALVPSRHPLLLLGLSIVFGIGFGGATPQLTTITLELFGLKAVGSLMGAVMALMGTIGAGGPVLGGLMFDLTGSYAPAYLIGAAILLGAIGCTLRLRPLAHEAKPQAQRPPKARREG